MIPEKFAPLLFNAILSGLMLLIVSAISTLRVLGPEHSFVYARLSSWIVAWAVAFPTVSLVAPITRKIVKRLTAPTSRMITIESFERGLPAAKMPF